MSTEEEADKKKLADGVLEYIKREDLKWFAAGIVAIVVATVGVQAWADDRIDKKVAPIQRELTAVKDELAKKVDELKSDIGEVKADAKEERKRNEEERTRNDQRWQAILQRLSVKDPAPSDGGVQ